MILSKKTETDHDQGEQAWGFQGGKGKGEEWTGIWGVFGCKVLYLEQMGNGAPLYSTEKCV